MHRAVAAIPLVLVPALGAVQGGFQPDTWVWAGALAAWASAVCVVVASSPGALRRAWPWAVATGALLVWTLLSTIWSVHAAQSLLEARRTLVYLAVVLALLLLVRRNATGVLVPATHIAISGLLVYALARYLLGARHRDPFELYVLSQPLGYGNAAGILAALALLLAVGLVAGESASTLRAGAAATVPVFAAVLVFTQSTASYLALAVGLAVTALLSPDLVRLLGGLALLASPAALAAALAAYSRLADDVPSPRIDGAAFLPIVLGCAGLAALIAARVPLRNSAARSRRARTTVAAAVVVAALGLGAGVARSGSTEPRASYYHVAWQDEVLRHPLLGTGAGTFGFYWARSGRVLAQGGALDAHSLYLETLGELGPLGLVLVAAMLLAPLRGVVRHRFAPYVPAAAGAYAAFLVHAGLDWDWELPAVVVAALCCGAAVAAAELDPGEPLGRTARGALLALSLVLGAGSIAGAASSTIPD